MRIKKEKVYRVRVCGFEDVYFRKEEDMDAYCAQLEYSELFLKEFKHHGVTKEMFDILFSFWDKIKPAMDDIIKHDIIKQYKRGT